MIEQEVIEMPTFCHWSQMPANANGASAGIQRASDNFIKNPRTPFQLIFAYFPKKLTRRDVKSLHRLGFSMSLLNANGRDNFARTAFSNGKWRQMTPDERKYTERSSAKRLREHRPANGAGVINS